MFLLIAISIVITAIILKKRRQNSKKVKETEEKKCTIYHPVKGRDVWMKAL